MSPRIPPTSGSRVWALAILGALALHAGAILGVRALDPLAVARAEPPAPSPIEVVFAPPAERGEPTFFSELPEDRADERPEKPDFLSNVDSRARDRASAGELSALPQIEGTSEAPQVRMDAGEPAPPGREEATAEAEETTDSPAGPEADAVREKSEPRNEPLLAALLREQLAKRPKAREPRPAGSSDLPQEAMANPSGNASLTGDISLSTTAWEYAPWLQAFRRSVFDRWHPPIAYHVGLIHGWVLVEAEIARDGRLERLDVLDADVGHESLQGNVLYALEAGAPYRALPEHFPDASLLLQIRFVYPKLRR